MRQFGEMKGRIFAAFMVVVTLLTSISVSVGTSADELTYEYGTVASGGSLAQVYTASNPYEKITGVKLAFNLASGKNVTLNIRAYENLTNPVDPSSGVEVYSGSQTINATAGPEEPTVVEQSINFEKDIVLTQGETLGVIAEVRSSDGQPATFRGVKGADSAYTRESAAAQWIGTEIGMIESVTENTSADSIPKDITYNVSPESIIADVSDTTTITVDSITPAYKRGVTYESSDAAIQAGTDGTVTYTSSVEGNITVKVEGAAEEKKISVKALESKFAEDEDTKTLTYNGQAQTPDVTVKCGAKTLNKESEYKVEYQNNTNVGEASAVITGVGTYQGYSHTLHFTIEQKEITEDMLENASFGINTATGEVTSASNIKDGEKELVLNQDFTASAVRTGNAVQIEDKKSYQTFNVTVNGIGNYASSAPQTKEQKIFASDGGEIDISNLVTIELDKERYTYNGEPCEPEVTLKMKDGSSLGADFKECCKIEYIDNEDAGTARVVVRGKKDCGLTGSVEKEFDIQKLSIASESVTASLDSTKYRHTGDPIRPEIDEITLNGKSLRENKDYTISYQNNEEITTPAMRGKVILTGMGNFKGVRELDFDIIGDLATEAQIGIRGKTARLRDGKYVSDYSDAYDGQPKTPLVTISLGDNELEEDEDFETDYIDNTNAGTATIRITGRGDYTGQSTEVTFTITPVNLTGSIQLTTDSFVYTGAPITVPEDEITVSKGILGGNYDPATDYDISYSSNTNAGKATITATGKGNYTGTINGAFTITPLPVTDPKITVDYTRSQPYTGNTIHPEVTVKLNGEPVDTRYYTVEYGGDCRNIGNGTGKITVKGKGNLSGSADYYFDITPKSIAGDNMRFVVGGVTAVKEGGKWRCAYKIPYTGVQQSPSIAVYDGSYQLRSLTDYTIFMANAINAGETAVIRVTGQGNYSGSEAEIYFTIAPKDITNDSQIRITDQGTTYDEGGYHLPDVTVMDLAVIDSKRNLVKGVDYTITPKNDDCRTAGEGRVAVITGIGNYTGTKEITYQVGDSLAGASVELSNPKTGKAYGKIGTNWQVEYLGNKLEPKAKLTVEGEELQEGRDYSVSYSSNVSDIHVAKFPNADITNIVTATYTGAGMYFGTVQTQYVIVQADISGGNFTAEDAQQTRTYDGNTVRPAPTVTYKLNGETIATLAKDTDYTLDKAVVGPNAGTTAVTIQGQVNYTGTLTMDYKIDPVDISGADVTVDPIANQEYTGEAIMPELTLRYHGRTLTPLVDYTASYGDNTVKGQATVTIQGQGNYTGTRTVHFTIIGRDLKDAYVTLIGETEYRYDKTAHTPDVLATYNGITLQKDRDYMVEYQNNTAPGKASVILRGQGNYEGTATLNFTIWGDLSDTSLFSIELPKVDGKEREYYRLVRESDGTYDLPDLNEAQVSVQREAQDGSKTPLTQGTDYDITFERCDRIGNGVIHISGKGDYIRNYQAKEIVIKGDLSTAAVELPQITYEYTGAEIRPVPNLVFGADGRSLINDVEFTYNNNTDAGEAQLTIKPKADNTTLISEKTVSYGIRYNLTGAEIEGLEPGGYDYTGEAIHPDFTVKCAGKTLIKNVDYTVSFGENIMAGTNIGVITISPVEGKSLGERVIRFTINGRDIAQQTLTVNDQDWSSSSISESYTGSPITPPVKVTDSKNGKELQAGKDYTVSYQDNTNAGSTAAIHVRGINGYFGQITKTFTITPVNISDASVTKEISSANYAGGEPVYPTIKLSFNGRTLNGAEEGTAVPANCDYTYQLSNNTSVTSSATVTINGKGNFTGTDTQTFEIKKTNLANGNIDIAQASTVYTGQEISLEDIAKQIEVTCPVGNGTKVKLEKDRHYSIHCSDTIKNAGRYAITIDAHQVSGDYLDENFEGSLRTFFTVEPKPLDDAEGIIVTPIPDQEYTKDIPTDGAEPKVEIQYQVKSAEGDVLHTEDLKEETDYTLSYRDNKAAGQATAVITAKDPGNYSGRLEVPFYIGKDIASGAVVAFGGDYPEAEGGYIYDLTEHRPSVTVVKDGKKLTAEKDYTVSYEEDVVNAGNKTVTVTGTGEYYGTVTKEYTIKKRPVKETDLTLTLTGLETDENGYYAVYDGKPVVPGTVLHDNTLNVDLKESDYEVNVYRNNAASTPRNLAQVAVTLKDDGNYTGGVVKSQDFEIRSRDLETLDPQAVITLSADGTTVEELEYTGAALCPDVTVRSGDTELVRDVDYTVAYEDNEKVGRARVIVTGIRNYSGTLEKEFVIYADLSKEYAALGVEKQFCTGQPLKPPVQLSIGGEPVAEEYYTVIYSTNDNWRTQGHVYVYADPDTEDAAVYYRKSCEADFEIGFDGDALRVEGAIEQYVYTGNPIEPAFKIIAPSGDEIAYRAEDVVYRSASGTADHTNVGRITATIPVVVTGSGGEEIYRDTKTVTFEIIPKNINACSINHLSGMTYAGRPLQIPVIIMYNDKELTQSKDYNVVYSDNTNPGYATALVAGIGNFTGTSALHFEIRPPEMIGVQAVPLSTDSIELSWKKNGAATGYQIYSGDAKTLYGVAGGTNYVVSGLLPHTQYTFKVRSYVQTGDQISFGPFETVSSYTQVGTVRMNGFSNQSRSATLVWTRDTSIDGYQIYRSASYDGEYKMVAAIPNTQVNYTDWALTSGSVYYYKVRAYKRLGSGFQYGPLSAPIAITVR